MKSTKVLGLTASLRGARKGTGVKKLAEELASLTEWDDLERFLSHQSTDILEAYRLAGRDQSKGFDEIYANLRRESDKGLSNSEVGIAAALWGALKEGAEVEYCNLSRYFPESGSDRFLPELESLLLESDGIVLSTPVYFGDRSSVAQAFLDFVYHNQRCREHLKDKVFGGVAVGAKRNGGQETALIYQLVDFINLGMLGVGNDSQSTSQYGGTIVAGDVGTAAKDDYGLKTSADTGRRVAHVASLMRTAAGNKLPIIDVLVVQDNEDGYGAKTIDQFLDVHRDKAVFRLQDVSREKIHRCIACDICPIAPGLKQEYRCIVKQQSDFFFREHENLIAPDAVILAAFSPKDKSSLHSTYQKMIERTRYLRRDDYAIGDILTAPLVISEVDSNQNLHIRMMTSMVRHHMVLHHPLNVFYHDGNSLNLESFHSHVGDFVQNATRLATFRDGSSADLERRREYVPLGYGISDEKRRTSKPEREKIKAERVRREENR